MENLFHSPDETVGRGGNALAYAVTDAKDGPAEGEMDIKSLAMDEGSFRTLYERTARPLWAYLERVSGDPALADDLLQECYCRFLSLPNPPQEAAHRKNYLFRIAANLLRDHWRKTQKRAATSVESADTLCDDHTVETVPLRSDLGRAFAQLKPRERQLLWLAYAEGASHKEIAESTGMKPISIRPLLFRARKRLLALIAKPSAGEKSRKAGS